VARQRDLENIRLLAEQKQREQEAEAIRLKELELAKQRELERLRIVEIQKIKENQEKLKAEAEAKERERLLALAEAEQRRVAILAEEKKKRAEAEAAENQKRLALAEEAEKKRVREASIALEKAKLAEQERIQVLEASRKQIEFDSMLKKETAEKQFDIQKAEWDKIKDSRNVDDFYTFLNKFPSGYIAEQALFALEKIQKSKIIFQANKNGFLEGVQESKFMVGDTYTYVVRDYFNDNEIGRYRFRVDKIDDGLVYFSTPKTLEARVFTEDGALIKSGSSNYDPPLPLQPSERFQVGKRWTSQTLLERGGMTVNLTFNMKITSADDLETEAGKFKTYKIESYLITQNGAVHHEIRWFQPGIGLPIKTEISVRNKNGKIQKYEKSELIYIKLAKR
jgi:chemotaxis protein histidine kinase CheA